jgi:uncharacterized membrane protein
MRILVKQLTVLLILVCSVVVAGGSSSKKHRTNYSITHFPSIGGTISRGNSINNDGLVSGFSFTQSDSRRHATVWKRDGTPVDLGTLAGPDGYSSVVWPVKNTRGIIAGITQTSIPDPNNENWSCSPFLYGVAENITGNTCVGFVWENDTMRPLPTLGGPNGFAAGANNRGQVTGWAETEVEDPTCVAPQKLQFLPVIYGPGHDQITPLPLISGDSSGAATAINDRGQAVGISGTCDQAVGRLSAKHAVLWERGRVIDIVGDNGGPYWNTPMAINRKGDVVGFVGTEGDFDANLLRAFIWTRHGGFRYLQPLEGDPFSQALGINNRGQAVGISCAFGGAPCKAVLWERNSTRAIDLNSRVPGYDGVLTSAQDINDDGQISGRANAADGERVAYLANPRRRHD